MNSLVTFKKHLKIILALSYYKLNKGQNVLYNGKTTSLLEKQTFQQWRFWLDILYNLFAFTYN